MCDFEPGRLSFVSYSPAEVDIRYFLNPSPRPFRLDPSVTPGLSLFRFGCRLSTVDCPLSHSWLELALLQLSGLLRGEGPSLNFGADALLGEYVEDSLGELSLLELIE